MAPKKGESKPEGFCEEKGAQNLEDDFEDELDKLYKGMALTDDTTCGIGIFRGSFLQILATKKVFVLVYGFGGMLLSSAFSYYGGSITTLEKRFKLSSKTTGILSIGNDVTTLLFSFALNYYAARGHRPRWLSLGLMCIAVFCFLNAVPHFIYGAGEDALALTKEYGSGFGPNATGRPRSKDTCGASDGNKCTVTEGNIIPVTIWFIGQLISGIGCCIYFTLGFSYLDDNIKKSKSPLFISFSYFVRTTGPTIGYTLVSFCLKLYIAPELTPVIDNLDPRWVGAWWLGWLILGGLSVFVSIILSMLPKVLPRAAARKELIRQRSKDDPNEVQEKPSIKDFIKTLYRLSGNKIYIYNQITSIFYIFGYLPFWVFLPKYIEIQYKQSASVSSLVTGSIGFVFSALGVMAAGIILQKFKPRAKSMALWNIFTASIACLGILGYRFIGCESVNQVHTIYDTNMTCNANCNCEFVKFSPVCSLVDSQTYISPCHAGCTDETLTESGQKIFSNCTCIPSSLEFPFPRWNSSEKSLSTPLSLSETSGGWAKSGSCYLDCRNPFIIFVIFACTMKFAGASSRVTNLLVMVRCVDEKDKAASLGIGMSFLSLFALIPSPIFFGYVMDSTCLVWGKTCSRSGNCWLYDSDFLRMKLNYIAGFFLFIAFIFDVLIWKNISDINMFDDIIPEGGTTNQSEHIGKEMELIDNKKVYKSVEQSGD